MRTYAYIDGFNLYFNALKDTPYKWLNLQKLLGYMFPKCDLIKIKYFTAMVYNTRADPSVRTRQEIYLRAIQTIKQIEIFFGRFQTNSTKALLCNPPRYGSKFVEVYRTVEKGSDVNLAAHLVNDAHNKRFTGAIVVSGDSDLMEPIRIVTEELKKFIYVVNPKDVPSCRLNRVASEYRNIRDGVLCVSQFSDKLKDSKGEFHKPSSW